MPFQYLGLKRVIIDTDPGIDDAAAILLALASPELSVEAITTVYGNGPVEVCTSNALRILHAAGRTDIPVYQGVGKPLLRQPNPGWASQVHGADALGNTSFPLPPTLPPVPPYQGGTAEGSNDLAQSRVVLEYTMPLGEMLTDFYNQLKSRTQGYASLDYNYAGYRAAPLVKVDVLINHQPVEALSLVLHRDRAVSQGRLLVEKLRTAIPRQLFEVPIQAAIGSRVIARETVRALRKDVLAKCYGGDVTRKRKLLEKQREGKKRLKRIGRVEVPQEAFLTLLKLGGEG